MPAHPSLRLSGQLSKHLATKITEATQLPDLWSKAKISISFLQIMASLNVAYTVPWPRHFKMVLNKLNVLNLNILNLPGLSYACVNQQINYFDEFLVAFCFPIILSAFFLAVYYSGIRTIRQKIKQNVGVVRNLEVQAGELKAKLTQKMRSMSLRIKRRPTKSTASATSSSNNTVDDGRVSTPQSDPVISPDALPRPTSPPLAASPPPTISSEAQSKAIELPENLAPMPSPIIRNTVVDIFSPVLTVPATKRTSFQASPVAETPSPDGGGALQAMASTVSSMDEAISRKASQGSLIFGGSVDSASPKGEDDQEESILELKHKVGELDSGGNQPSAPTLLTTRSLDP